MGWPTVCRSPQSEHVLTKSEASTVETDPKTPDQRAKKVGEAHLIDGLAYGVLGDAIGAHTDD
eukprot:3261232-Rhodomonas_salina.1